MSGRFGENSNDHDVCLREEAIETACPYNRLNVETETVLMSVGK